ncbi:hypothetical protein [Hyalangium rubrum]|uniref:Lipoprotein n=1 Tax=Hyalangium rubrum TaxID=3103134 RepID=A0ABU5GVN5_9BACT|nr:hypothetical protein [Hyalangium sp. s54d21]MDY7224962.1 hypothetical protein [Hyalangium sp. s54d21]
MTPLWVRTQGASGYDELGTVTTDATGNAVMSFMYTGQADASGTPLPWNGATYDLHAGVVKYRPDGSVAWAQSFVPPFLSVPHDENHVRVRALTTDAPGEVFVGGSAYLGATVAGRTLPPGAFLAKLEGATGQVRWTLPVQPPPNTELYFEDFEATPDGDFVALARLDVFTPSGGYEGSWAMVLKYRGSDGDLLWSLLIHHTSWDDMVHASDLSVDDVGNVYVCGSFRGTMNFGPLKFSSPVSPGGESLGAGYLVALNGSGEHRWSRLVLGAPDVAPKSVSAFRHRVLLTATGSPTFQGQNLPRGQYVMGYYSENGEERWARQLSPIVSAGDRVFVRTSGEEAVVLVQNDASLLGVPRSRLVDPDYFVPKQTFFVARFWRTNGHFLGARNFEEVVPALGGVLPATVAISPVDAQVLVTGHFNGVMDFGTGGVVTPRGRADAFLLRLAR